MTDIPNPGSNEALKMGCTCPVLDNANGKGAWGGMKDKDGNTLFWYSDDCPLHKHLLFDEKKES